MTGPRDRLTPSFSFGIKRKQGGEPPKQRQEAGPASGQPNASAPSPPSPPAPTSSAATPGSTFRDWVGAPKATLAIVFTDIVSSAALANTLGNRTMDVLRRSHFQHAAELVRRHGGFVIKTIGDSVMAAFHAASDALDFAMAIHSDPGDGRIQVRAGIHVGPISVEEQDAFGVTVNYASRVVNTPRDAEIWLSSEAKGHVDQEGEPHHARLPWQTHGGLELKGFPGKHILWSITMR
jgi:class 3 adenylate cyclase